MNAPEPFVFLRMNVIVNECESAPIYFCAYVCKCAHVCVVHNIKEYIKYTSSNVDETQAATINLINVQRFVSTNKSFSDQTKVINRCLTEHFFLLSYFLFFFTLKNRFLNIFQCLCQCW